eukprot:1160874-Pelagomonas_calceolata.AAC.4
MIKRPEDSLSPGALVFWCKFGNPPFPAQMGARQPLRHTEHLHMSDFLHFSMLGTYKYGWLAQSMHRGGYRARECSWPYLGRSSHGDDLYHNSAICQCRPL